MKNIVKITTLTYSLLFCFSSLSETKCEPRIKVKVGKEETKATELKSHSLLCQEKLGRGGKGQEGQAGPARSHPAQPRPTAIPGPGSPCGCGRSGGTAWPAAPAHAGWPAVLLCCAGRPAPQAPGKADPGWEELAPQSSCRSPGESVWPPCRNPNRGVAGWRFLFAAECCLRVN